MVRIVHLGRRPIDPFLIMGRSNGANAMGVTSVGLIMPAIFNVAGSPVTHNGSFTVTILSQTKNQFWAAPSAANGVPSFRAITDTDIATSRIIASTCQLKNIANLPGQNYQATVDWNNCILVANNGVTILDWIACNLNDNNGGLSIDWKNHIIQAAGIQIMTWGANATVQLPNIPTADPGDGTNSLWMDPVTRMVKVGT